MDQKNKKINVDVQHFIPRGMTERKKTLNQEKVKEDSPTLRVVKTQQSRDSSPPKKESKE